MTDGANNPIANPLFYFCTGTCTVATATPQNSIHRLRFADRYRVDDVRWRDRADIRKSDGNYSRLIDPDQSIVGNLAACDGFTNPDADANRDTNGYSDRNSNCSANGNANSDPFCDAISYTTATPTLRPRVANSYADTHGDTYANSNSYADCMRKEQVPATDHCTCYSPWRLEKAASASKRSWLQTKL